MGGGQPGRAPYSRSMTNEPTAAAGTSLAVAEAIISRARQRRMLAACDVDAARYGAAADPALLAIDCFVGVRRSKVRAPDRLLHIEQRIQTRLPIALDEKLGVRAKVEAVEQTPGRERARAVFDFLGADGSVAVTAAATTLVAEPSWLRDVAPFKGDPHAGHRLVARKLLNPTKVQAYSEETGNRLHFDPAYAVRYGLRAPVASALMALTWSVEALAQNGLPTPLDLTARFQSPLFWDDGVDILVRDDPTRAGRIVAVRCVSSAGALVCETDVA